MSNEAFSLFGLQIYWYGILFAGGFLAAIAHWTRLGRLVGKPPELAVDVALWMMIGTVVGARTAYVLANLAYFAENPIQILNVRDGGLVFYGGLIGGSIGVALFARLRRLALLPLADFLVTGLPLGHAIGRVGCFLNGCCHGIPTDRPWGVIFKGIRSHPTQLYETAGNLLVFLIVWQFYLSRPAKGRTLALYLLTYPLLRFMLEFYRGDARLAVMGLHTSQWTSLLLLSVGLVLWRVLRNGPPSFVASERALRG